MASNTLRNPRHEIYAQGICAGLSREDAYQKAGYAPSARNSGALNRRPEIKARIEQLLNQARARCELSRKDILDRIIEDWDLARKLGQTASALKAAELYGRDVHRMFVERKEVGGPGDFDKLSEQELRDIIKKDMEALGWDEKDAPIPPSAIN